MKKYVPIIYCWLIYLIIVVLEFLKCQLRLSYVNELSTRYVILTKIAIFMCWFIIGLFLLRFINTKKSVTIELILIDLPVLVFVALNIAHVGGEVLGVHLSDIFEAMNIPNALLIAAEIHRYRNKS